MQRSDKTMKDTAPLSNNGSISNMRQRSLSNFVRYRTYLTPPSNPFREGKSKLQLLKEAALLLVILTLLVTVVGRFLQHDDASSSVTTTASSLPATSASFDNQLHNPLLRGSERTSPHRPHHHPHDGEARHEEQPPNHTKEQEDPAHGGEQGGDDADQSQQKHPDEEKERLDELALDLQHEDVKEVEPADSANNSLKQDTTTTTDEQHSEAAEAIDLKVS